MDEAEIGIFGGSGFYSFLEDVEEVELDTPYGKPSAPLVIGELGGKRVAFLPRHGRKHELPPHVIPYRANVWAMKELGVRRIIGPNASGALRAELRLGEFVVCDQFVDRTSGRKDTFYDGPETTHVSAADPYCPDLRALLVGTARELDIPVRDAGTVVTIQGPRFSTRAESRWFQDAGWDVINMSATDCPIFGYSVWVESNPPKEATMAVTPNKKLALVVRVSDVKGRDRKGDRFIAPDEQVRTAEAYARGRGYDLQVFQDLNVSHTTPLDERPGMGEALRWIEAGELAGLVVSSQDRLGPLDITRELKTRLLTAGAVLLVPDNPGIEELEAKGYKKLPGESMALIHEAQREEIGLRWAASRRAAVKRGVHICRVAPTGLRKNEKPPRISGKAREELTPEQRWADPVEGQLVPGDPKIVAAIKQCFRIRARRPRGSWSDVCKVLEKAGALNAKGEPYWTRSAAARIIENPAYKGVAFHGKDIRNPDAHEPIVDELTWKRAQVEEESAPTRGSIGALLGGVARCDCCGRKLTPSLTEGRYRCRPRIIAGPPCSAPANCAARDIEPYVVKAFLDLCAYRPAAPIPPDLSNFEEAVAKAEAALAKWQAQAAADEVDPEDFRPVLDARKAELEAAKTALAEAREAAGLNDERLSLLEGWGSLTVPEQRAALHTFGVEAHVRREAYKGEPVDERTTIVMRGAPIGEGWEPDDERHVIYSWGDETVAAWNARFADHPNLGKIVVEPIKLSPEMKEAEEAIFGTLHARGRRVSQASSLGVQP